MSTSLTPEQINQIFPFVTAADSIREKSWAIGSKQCSTELHLAASNKYTEITLVKLSSSPAMWKCIDEIISNALDRVEKTKKFTDMLLRTDIIRINFDASSGVFIVYNNGTGIPIQQHAVAQKQLGRTKPIYIPTLLMSIPFQGSNYARDTESLTGGTNGLGMKATNFHSDIFTGETCDIASRQMFSQTWKDQGREESEALIKPLAHNDIFTRITFRPAYEKVFGVDKSIFNDMQDVVAARCLLLASYMNFMYPHAKLYYNNIHLQHTCEQIARMIFGITGKRGSSHKTFAACIKPTVNENSKFNFVKYDWEACVVVGEVPTNLRFGAISVVNGLVVKKGSHINTIFDQIYEAVAARLTKEISKLKTTYKLSENKLREHLFFVLNAPIPDPTWEAQRKYELSDNARKFKGYVMPQAALDAISAAVVPNIITDITTTDVGKLVKTSTQDEHADTILRISYPYYIPIDRPNEGYLIVVEGVSAYNQLKAAHSKIIGDETFAMLAMQGVAINPRKLIKEAKTLGVARKIFRDQLLKNKFIDLLCYILGINKLNAAATKCNYKGLVVCVDQDYDGKGNIFPLLMNIFDVLWPELMKKNPGFIKWFQTPIARAYYKNDVRKRPEEFYLMEDREDFYRLHGDVGYRYKEYKGLGSHNEKEALSMCRNFPKKLVDMRYDSEAERNLEIFYGKDSAGRKKILSEPQMRMSQDVIHKMKQDRELDITIHLKTSAVEFALDNLQRKIYNICDGLNQIGRKILMGAMLLPNKSEQIKTVDFAGFISKEVGYSHGDQSIQEAISRKALIAIGANQCPLLLPEGFHGSRGKGGGDRSQPRYTYIRPNMKLIDLLYPKEDLPLLEYETDSIEPRYFMPTMPMAILESLSVPAHGWAVNMLARDFPIVLWYVLSKIEDPTFRIPDEIPICTYARSPYKFSGRFVKGDASAALQAKFGVEQAADEEHEDDDTTCDITDMGKQVTYMVGTYQIHSDDIVVITDLPLRVYYDDYTIRLKKNIADIDSPMLKDVINKSARDEIKIIVHFRPGMLEYLLSEKKYLELVPGKDGAPATTIVKQLKGTLFDPVEEYLNLYVSIRQNLVYLDEQNKVVEPKSYGEVIERWFEPRKLLYEKRIKRMLTLMDMEIMTEQYILQYLSADINVRKPLVVVEKELTALNYPKIHPAAFNNPKRRTREEIEKCTLSCHKVSYDYLLNLTDKQRTNEKVAERQAALDALIAKRDALKSRAETSPNFYGSNIWRDELEQLLIIFEEGEACRWGCEDDYGDEENGKNITIKKRGKRAKNT